MALPFPKPNPSGVPDSLKKVAKAIPSSSPYGPGKIPSAAKNPGFATPIRKPTPKPTPKVEKYNSTFRNPLSEALLKPKPKPSARSEVRTIGKVGATYQGKPLKPGKGLPGGSSVKKGVPEALKPKMQPPGKPNSIYGPGKVPEAAKPKQPSIYGPGKIPSAAKPAPGAPTPGTKPKPKTEAPKSGGYKVKKGDSLWSIAERNKPKGTTTDKYFQELKKANPDSQFKSGKRGLIYTGENVNLPKSPKDLAAKLTDIRRGGR